MATSTVTETRVLVHNTDMEGYASDDDDVMPGSSRRPSAPGWGSVTLGCCEDDDGAGQYNESPSILLSSDNGNRPLFRRSDQVMESGPAAPVSGVELATAAPPQYSSAIRLCRAYLAPSFYTLDYVLIKRAPIEHRQ